MYIYIHINLYTNDNKPRPQRSITSSMIATNTSEVTELTMVPPMRYCSRMRKIYPSIAVRKFSGDVSSPASIMGAMKRSKA